MIKGQDIRVGIGDVGELAGDLIMTPGATACVMVVQGSGNSRKNHRNEVIVEELIKSGYNIVLLDLLTFDEKIVDLGNHHMRFEVYPLAHRLCSAINWFREQKAFKHMPLGLFGAGAGCASALLAAAQLDREVGAVVSRGGRPDLAGTYLPLVKAPTLLITGSDDATTLQFNKEAISKMRCPHELEIVEGASHLFVEPGKLEEVANLAIAWFNRFLAAEGMKKAL